jgi:alkylation response protein AidB-like acyl-CoA dehydrogenase
MFRMSTLAASADLSKLLAELGEERSVPGWATFSLELNDDQQLLRRWVHEFAADVLRPAAAEWDEREELPWPLLKRAAEVGLYSTESMLNLSVDPSGLLVPIVVEELFWGDAGFGMVTMGTALATTALTAQGTPEQVLEWLPRCFGSAEDPQVATLCSSEPNAGSDVSNMRTRARYEEAHDEWVINGSKSWSTNGGLADVHIVVATVDPSLGSRGHASFVVPKSEIAGITQGSKVKKHGLRASHTADVHLDDARVPGRYLLGGRERLQERLARAREGGHSKGNAAMAAFERTRAPSGSMAVGIARAAYEYALEYSLQREQFGRRIVENQAIAFKLANMKVEIDAARLLVWRAAWMAAGVMRGTPCAFDSAEGSIAKYKASEVAVWVTQLAMQILGGNGYTREYPVERFSRDARAMTIVEGTSEIQQLVIARALSGVRIP